MMVLTGFSIRVNGLEAAVSEQSVQGEGEKHWTD